MDLYLTLNIPLPITATSRSFIQYGSAQLMDRLLLVYVLDEKWLADRAEYLNLAVITDPWTRFEAIQAAANNVLLQTGLGRRVRLKVVIFQGQPRMAVGLASSVPNDRWPMPPQHVIDSVKCVLGVHYEPMWLPESI
ncbi:unnamed protein product [Somion occarium]|uniref:Uncharacterized protein n=1 Tax=Somion occarium TaxID=3059160 RepID=A0ABP1DQN6_9APHY